MSRKRTSLCVLAGTGLLLGLTAAPAEAAPSPCATGAQAVAVEEFNELLARPLWASLDQAYLERQDRNGDGLLCVRIVTPSSVPPGLGIPAGETNILVLTVDNPGGRR